MYMKVFNWHVIGVVERRKMGWHKKGVAELKDNGNDVKWFSQEQTCEEKIVGSYPPAEVCLIL